MDQTSVIPANGVSGRADSPDIDCHPCTAAARGAGVEGSVVRIEWDDGVIRRCNAMWLRDDSAGEQTLDISTLPADPRAAPAHIDASGALAVHRLPEDRSARHHPGGLRAFDHANDVLEWVERPGPVPWMRETLAEPRNFDGQGLLERDAPRSRYRAPARARRREMLNGG